jgi:hypothetical protein
VSPPAASVDGELPVPMSPTMPLGPTPSLPAPLATGFEPSEPPEPAPLVPPALSVAPAAESELASVREEPGLESQPPQASTTTSAAAKGFERRVDTSYRYRVSGPEPSAFLLTNPARLDTSSALRSGLLFRQRSAHLPVHRVARCR